MHDGQPQARAARHSLLHQGTIRIEDVPAPSPTPAPSSALSAVAAGHGDHGDHGEQRDPAPRRASMRFVIRIPCEAPGTAAG